LVLAALLGMAACRGGAEQREPLVATAEERGSVSTPCGYSHSGPDDPIVHAGHVGASHRHDFFGAVTTDAASDAASLLEGGTTCRSTADHSAYWAPSLLAAGRPLEPTEMLAYYRVPVGAHAAQVQAPPNGLEMIAGDAAATEPQDQAVVSWRCGSSPDASPVPLACPEGSELRLLLVFDPCWNGEDLGSPDHRSHLTGLGDDGACPPSHPVLLPELTLEVRYPTGGVDDGLALASGPLTGGHGDALLAWGEEHMAREVEVCLRRNARCDVVSESTRLGIPSSSSS
jgi:hypothetical protein